MPIGVIFEFPGAMSRKRQTDLERAKEETRRLAGQGGARAHCRTDAWRLVRDRCLAIASGLQPIWQKAEAGFERGRDSTATAEDFSPRQIHQILAHRSIPAWRRRERWLNGTSLGIISRIAIAASYVRVWYRRTHPSLHDQPKACATLHSSSISRAEALMAQRSTVSM
jgi:hypothetical protein